MNKLNEQEIKFLKELFDFVEDDFELTFSEDKLRSDEGCNVFGNAKTLSTCMQFNVKQIEGYLSDLSKKGIIFIEAGTEYGFDETVVWLTEKGYEAIK